MKTETNDLTEMRLAYKNEGFTNETPGVSTTPLFPIEGFPAALQEIINNCASTYGTPRDYWAGAVLIATALAIGNKMELVNNYRNMPVLWLVLLGDVSSGKSNPLDFCLDYFKKLDSHASERYGEDLLEYRHIQSLKAKDKQAAGIDERMDKPLCFQYILNDFTPEAMVEAHRTNNRGLLIERDELKGWIDDFGRYNKSGEQSNMLSSWSGIKITYNRKTTGIMNIQHPCVFVCGGMQPDLLPSLAADKRAENGFLSRFCAVFPDNTKKTEYNTKVLSEKIRKEWDDYLSILVNMNIKLELRLCSEAEAKYSEWYNRNVKMSNEEPSGYLKGVYGKLDIISLRLAIIISGMKMACEGRYSSEITGSDMEAALALTEYFRATALKVYRKLFTADKVTVTKKEVANYLFKVARMNKAEISRVLKTSRPQVDRWVS